MRVARVARRMTIFPALANSQSCRPAEPGAPFLDVPIGHTQDVPLASREAGLPTLTTRQQTQHLPKELCPISWQGRDEHPNHGGKQNLEAYLRPFGLVPLGGK